MSKVSTSPNAKQIARQLWECKHDPVKRAAFLVSQRKAVKALRSSQKATVVAHYGGKCRTCGITDIDILTVDHVNEDGHLLGTSGKRSNRSYQYADVIRSGFPDSFQLLCFTCNHLKHVASLSESTKPSAMEYKKLRRDVIAGYGGKCPCGEERLDALTIDHVNNDGSQDRAAIGTVKIYRRLRRENFPSGYQVLCLNCNWKRFLESVKLRQHFKTIDTLIAPLRGPDWPTVVETDFSDLVEVKPVSVIGLAGVQPPAIKVQILTPASNLITGACGHCGDP